MPQRFEPRAAERETGDQEQRRQQLDTLQGVGPATAQKIVDYRTANGPFTSIEDIKNVSGIGDAKFAAMKDAITV